MKNSNIFLVLTIISLFLLVTCSSEKKYSQVKLKSREDTVSYYLGMTYGNGLKQAKVDSIFNSNAFAKGMNEAINSDSLTISPYIIQNYLSAYFTEFQAQQLRIQYKEYIAENSAFLESNSKKDSVVTLPSGLQYIVLCEGKGNMPVLTDRIKVHYTGRLIDGTIFDSSYKRNEPAEFNVRDVIPGWTEAMQLMPVGSKWRVFIPENLAYGSNVPQGSLIKPFSTLIFDVELLDILAK
jgi:FKBP-type peptidyl-prolyl cis-trans isomerase FklB